MYTTTCAPYGSMVGSPQEIEHVFRDDVHPATWHLPRVLVRTRSVDGNLNRARDSTVVLVR